MRKASYGFPLLCMLTTLCACERETASGSTIPYLFPIAFFIVGLVCLFAPSVAWYFTTGWRCKDGEPTDFAIWLHRAMGVVYLVVAIALMLV